jgi:septum formation protein
MGIKFSLTRADIEECQFADEVPADFVSRMAREKALAVADMYPESWILSADTIVVLNDEILGKPEDESDAVRMLTGLAGNWHQVFTAFTLHHPGHLVSVSRLDSSQVKIAALSAGQIKAYINTGESLDKAGSYAVQGIGGAFVEAIEGSPTTVIGLPMPLVIVELLRNCIIS